MEIIEIAKIVKPQGIKGDVKILPLVSAFNFSGKTVFINKKPTKIEKVYNVGGGIAIKLDCISSRNEAEKYRNLTLSIDKSDIDVPQGEYLIADILKKQIFLDSGEFVGELIEVFNFGAADVFLIKSATPKHYIMCSHKDGLIVSVDNSIVFNHMIYAEVSVDYEDN